MFGAGEGTAIKGLTPVTADNPVICPLDLVVPAGYLDIVDSVSGTGQGEGLRG